VLSERFIEPECPGREPAHRLVLAVHRLALEQQATYQHPQCLGIGQSNAPVVGGHERFEVGFESETVEEVVHQGQRTQPLGAKSE
jgi:hypothetical protein